MVTAQLDDKNTKNGCAFVLRKGDTLQVIDPTGGNTCNMVLFNARDIREKMCSGKTLEFEKNIQPTTGNTLWSNRSNKLLEIVKDTHGNNDVLMPPCPSSGKSNDTGFASCLSQMIERLGNFSIAKDDIPDSFNIFKKVMVDGSGSLTAQKPSSKAGDTILFRANMDLIVGLTACDAAGREKDKINSIYYEVICAD
ncbi:MAG: urea carboxylase-associated protein [Cytophagaceae bacterium]|nr:urea carboxylase-associated protein [Cytophagaceae bacterium]|tara:strand:+ start:8196 stop:8783 length:588 start_codon:yes stop_codon:yes gene_type:complete